MVALRQKLIASWICAVIEKAGEFVGNKKTTARGKPYTACGFKSLTQCQQFWLNNTQDKRVQTRVKACLRTSTNPKEFDGILELLVAKGAVCIHEDEDKIHLPIVGVIDILVLS